MLSKIFSVFTFFRDFFAFFENFPEEKLPILSVKTDNSHYYEYKNDRMGKDCRGSTKDIISKPKYSIYGRTNTSHIGLLLYDADGKEPNRNAGNEVEGRGHHNDRNGGEARNENAGQPNREWLSLFIEEEAHDSLYNGENYYTADRDTSLNDILER